MTDATNDLDIIHDIFRVNREMGRVHQLITTHGFEEAKARAVAKLDRQCIEAAFAVMTDEEQRIGVMHAGFSMTALPHKDIEETVWTRRGGSVRLRIDSGTAQPSPHFM